MSNFLVNLVLPAIEKAGEEGVEAILQRFHDNNPTEYEASIKLLHQAIQPLKAFVDEKGSKLGDLFVAEFDKALTESAAANGITLT